jgi:hypothetical protein
MSLFCKNCDNILGISRNAPKKQIIDEDTPTVMSSTENALNYDDIVEKIANGEKISDEDFSKIDYLVLQQNKTFQSKNNKIKSKIKKMIEEMIEHKDSTDNNVKAFRICKNCSYSEPIKSKQLIISKMNEGNFSSDIELTVKNKNKAFSKALPLTREYNCRNKNCPTKKGEPCAAKFYRIRNTTQMWYTCTLCNEAWKIS